MLVGVVVEVFLRYMTVVAWWWSEATSVAFLVVVKVRRG